MLMMYDLLEDGRMRLRAAVLAPVMFKMAYCAVVDTIPVAALVPVVFARVTLPVVIVTARPPATAISR